MKPQAPVLAQSLRMRTFAAMALCLAPLLLQLPPATSGVVATAGVLVVLASRQRPLPALLRIVMAMAAMGLVLATAGFALGRDTGCALLAAMLALKPSETFRVRDARSLLGFALFAPFAAFLLDQGPWTLALGLCGATAVLFVLQQLSESESRPETGALRGMGVAEGLSRLARLAAIGLPLALAAFWLFPRLATPLWGIPERALARPGLSDSMTPGGWIDLMADDTPALRVQFFGATPDPSQMYWRGPTLQDFDGRTWKRMRWLAGGEAAAVRREGPTWDYLLEQEPTEDLQGVALELPLAAPAGMALARDYTLQAQRRIDSVRRWRMRSSMPAAYEPALSPFMRQRMLELPEGYNPRTLALARQWRNQAGANDAAIVERALRMIREGFAYTLETPLPGHDAVDEFLFDTREGYCEHFSSAFVVLMRAAGIPARVVTGYAGGYRNPFGGYWIVRRMDAHAWAEVWLPQRGWVRVDPTAAVAPERVYDTLDDRATQGFGALGALAPVFDLGDWLRRGWNDIVLGFDATRQQRILRPLGIDRVTGSRLLLLFGVASGLALAWMAWLSARGERERDPLLRAWHRMGVRYARLGLGRAPHEPADTWVARVVAAGAASASALAALAQRFVESRYARPDPHAGGERALIRDLRAHRPILRQGSLP